MKANPARKFRPNACQRCHGTAFLDTSEEPEWRCLQCGRLVVIEEDVTVAGVAAVPAAARAA